MKLIRAVPKKLVIGWQEYDLARTMTPIAETKPNDSRKKSLSEAFVNSFGSYPIGYAIGILVLPFSVGWIYEDPITANIFITLIYASVSFARVYVFRRMFLRRGIDENFIKLGVKLFHKITSKIMKNQEGNKL